MNSSNPNIIITEPDPGHFVIRGHAHSYAIEGGGIVAPMDICDIPPSVPTELLSAIVASRINLDGLSAAMPTLDAIEVHAADLKEAREQLEKVLADNRALHAEVIRLKSTVQIPIVNETPAKKVHWKTAQKQARETSEVAQ